MPTNHATPEARAQAVSEDAARLLSDAVLQFTERALDSRLKPFADAAGKAARCAGDAAESAQAACADLEAALGELRRVPDAYLRTATARVEELVRETGSSVTTATTASVAALASEITCAAGSLQSATSGAVGAAARFEAALDDLRAGPPALAAFLVEAGGLLRALHEPLAAVDADVTALREEVAALRRSNRVALTWLAVATGVMGSGFLAAAALLLR
jgi:hypothetical protein